MSKLTWCDKSTELAIALHTANMEQDHATANSKEALEAIGRAVVEHVGHTGDIPTANSVRAKLSSAKVYKRIETTANKPKGGTTVTKAEVVNSLQESLGMEASIATLVNGNLKELEAVAQRVAALRELTIHNATREQLEQALENLKDAEIDAIANGADVSEVAQVEQATNDLMDN